MLAKKIQTLPQDTREALYYISHQYKNAGYQCYLVGGCCRDLLMDETPDDFDFATNCPLPITKKLFQAVFATGEAHGTLTLKFKNQTFEVTRFRKDISTDGRRAVISFAQTIEEDQMRRDLRLNAMAYDVLENRLIDSQKGLDDLKEKLVRFVGQAANRIKEDHLRALRYGRLITRTQPLGFSYIQAEMDEVIKVFDESYLSIERIYDEFNKFYKIRNPDLDFIISFLNQLHLFSRFFTNPTQAATAVKHMLLSNSILPLGFYYRFNHNQSEAGKLLKISRKHQKIITLLLRFQKVDLRSKEKVKQLLYYTAQLDPLKIAHFCKILFKQDPTSLMNDIFNKNEPYNLAQLNISAQDLKNIGLAGSLLGEIYLALLQQVWKKPELNQNILLIKLAQELKSGIQKQT